MSNPPPMLEKAWPGLGHVPQFHRDRVGLLQRGYDTLGPVFGIRLGRTPVAVLVGPDLQEAFFTHTDGPLRMDRAYKFLRAAFGDIAFTVSPEQYRAERHILHGPFRGGKMPHYVEVMDETVQSWIDGFGDSGEFEVMSEMKALTQRIAARAFLGDAFAASVDDEFWALYEHITLSLDPLMPAHWPVPKNRRRDAARRRMIALLKPLIAARRSGETREDDFLQTFVETTFKDGSPVDDEKIVNYLLGLLFAGHETTSGHAAWSVVEVLRHPSYRFLMEQERAKAMAAGGPLTLETLAKLRLFNWAVKETERLRPVTDVLIRYVNEDFAAGDFTVPTGWLAMVSPAVAHRMPEYFANPHVFDPFRFGPDRAEDKAHRFSLITFGGGVHKCTGMNFAYNEIMVILARLMEHFHLELATAEPRPVYGMGASHPSPTRIRYRRITGRAAAVGAAAPTAATGCPFQAATVPG